MTGIACSLRRCCDDVWLQSHPRRFTPTDPLLSLRSLCPSFTVLFANDPMGSLVFISAIDSAGRRPYRERQADLAPRPWPVPVARSSEPEPYPDPRCPSLVPNCSPLPPLGTSAFARWSHLSWGVSKPTTVANRYPKCETALAPCDRYAPVRSSVLR